jgi:hypothetical protein
MRPTVKAIHHGRNTRDELSNYRSWQATPHTRQSRNKTRVHRYKTRVHRYVSYYVAQGIPAT